MRNLATAALLAAAKFVSAQDKINFIPAFSLGLTQSWVREATTTLVLPPVPGPQKDRLALWAGMGTSGGDLIQALAVSFSDLKATLQGEQLGGKRIPPSAGDKLTMHYKYNDSTGKYDQTASINGMVVSTLSTSSGNAEGWGTAVECQDDACVGTVVAHKYTGTNIVLNTADNSFGEKLGLKEDDSSGLTSSDNGKTWTVDSINIHAYTFNT